MSEKILEKEQIAFENRIKEKEQILQKEQKKQLRKTIIIYYPNGEHEYYTNEEYQWEYMSDEIRGQISKYADMPFEITLYQYNILNIIKRDKSEIIRISGNYAVKEIYEK